MHLDKTNGKVIFHPQGADHPEKITVPCHCDKADRHATFIIGLDDLFTALKEAGYTVGDGKTNLLKIIDERLLMAIGYHDNFPATKTGPNYSQKQVVTSWIRLAKVDSNVDTLALTGVRSYDIKRIC